MLEYLAIGAVAGLIVSSWQGFKDPPWEGFSTLKFLRSIVVGMLAGGAFHVAVSRGVISVDNYGMLAFAILPIERIIDEGYKGFFRRSDHAEFHKLLKWIHVPTHIYPVKVAAGIGFVAGALWLLRWLGGWLEWMITHWYGRTVPGMVIGILGGLLVATGGALKDSQFEGFIWSKFLRSPVVGALTGMLLIHYLTTPLLIVLATIGSERVAVECYKTFLARRVRGIHAGQPVRHPEWLARRPIFAVSYSFAVTTCLVMLLI